MNAQDFRAECDSADATANAVALVIGAIPVIWLALLALGVV